jgi:acyl-CoA reductase-like NAD-dependent aldehyde dehydrogenase
VAAPKQRPAKPASTGGKAAASGGKSAAASSNGASRAVARRTTRVIAAPPSRVEVRKTYKLYIGGQFPRSESGRSYVVAAADGTPLANAVRASRKDLRDAVRSARGAAQGWADRTAMNRGQVLYRVAELMEGRRDQFVAEVELAEGLRPEQAREVVARSIDRWVWYAGWADKIAQVLGSSNPVASDFFNFTIPEPTGVVGIVAPETSSLLGLVSRLAPPLVAGNAVLVLASEARPLPAITLTEVLATSDVPAGVVNVLTGRKRELVPVLAAHVDVDSIDVWGVPDDLRADVELSAADSIKRVVRRPAGTTDARFDWLDDRASERPEWIAAYLEMKTVWHPIGL